MFIRYRERALGQQQIKRNPKAKNTWLAGFVKCGNCGYALVRKNYLKKNYSYFLCSHKMNDNLCCGCGVIHADEFEDFILQKVKEKLADFKVIEVAGATANNPKIEELKARQIAIDNEIGETVKNVAKANRL
ncbi:MAG: zinc ribbon domain-containing protein [Eubacterium sp.]